MKIVADENIPHINHYFGHAGELVLKPGRSITHHDVKNADLLLIRSVTKVNQALLQNTSVKFVGCVTTGTDHMDTKWLDESGITWAAAEGCNAMAVKEYVLCTIAALRAMHFLTKPNLRAGVIGVGRIGSLVASELETMGFDVVLCDPFRGAGFVSLEEMTNLDFITLHTPLTFDGPHPTYHMIDKIFLQRQKSDCILLNTSRGAVINTADLKNSPFHFCLDVWENEPNIDLELLRAALIATPHIAGYSVQSKYRGIEMIYHFALSKKIISHDVKPIKFPSHIIFDKKIDKILQIYNPLATSHYMKEVLLGQTETFDHLRKNFPERHEFDYVRFQKEVVVDE